MVVDECSMPRRLLKIKKKKKEEGSPMPGSCVVTSQVEEKEGGRWGERKRERERT